MGIKKRVKKELGYMVKGAKVLPKAIKAAAKNKIEEAREQRRMEIEIEKQAQKEANAAFRKEYKAALIEKRKEQARAKARKRVETGGGFGGILGTLGKAGKNLEGYDPVGIGDFSKGVQKSQSVSNYMLEGLPAAQKPHSQGQKRHKKKRRK